MRNARDARWLEDDLGTYCSFEGEGERFPELGVNLTVLQPGRLAKPRETPFRHEFLPD